MLPLLIVSSIILTLLGVGICILICWFLSDLGQIDTNGEDWDIDSDVEERPICPGCGNQIDPTVCCCGSDVEYHHESENHPFIPMGCDCHRSKSEEG